MQFDQVAEMLVKKFQAWGKVIVLNFPNFIIAVLVFSLFVIVARLIKAASDRLFDRVSENYSINRMVASILYTAIVLTGVFVALGILKLDKTVSSLLAGAGIIGLALGFAFQEVMANFASGIIIAFRKPFVVGDVVAVKGFSGTVDRINMRASVLRTFEGQEAIIPNKDMMTQVVVNFSRTRMRRVDVAVTVGYASRLADVENLLHDMFKAFPLREPSQPLEVFFRRFNDSGIDVTVRFWVPYPGDNHIFRAPHEAIKLIHATFAEHGVTIPYPVRTFTADESLRGLLDGAKKES